MDSVFASNAADQQSDQTIYYAISICYFCAKHAAIRRKSNNQLSWDADDVLEWSDVLFQWVSTINPN